MPAVEVEDLTKTYGSRRALDEVSFAVDPGECLALLGPNGAGKSTLVEILATLKQPDQGDARVAGASVTGDPATVRQRVGVAFQTPIAHDHLTAREVVLHHAELYAVPRPTARNRAEELLAFVGLEDRADDSVGDFSEGMKRRVDLARVLVAQPDVLLLDEPAAGLDLRGRRAIRDRLAELRSRGTTLLLATHQMREVQTLADRVAVLHEGRLRALDEPRTLTEDLGAHVVQVDLTPDQDPQPVREALTGLGLARVQARPDGLEAALTEEGPSPGDVVDALEEAGLAYDQVSVRRPDLADVFLDVTGDTLEGATPGEGAA